MTNDELKQMQKEAEKLKCDSCGEPCKPLDPSWRSNGKGWEHKCPNIPAICGHIGRAVQALIVLALILPCLGPNMGASNLGQSNLSNIESSHITSDNPEATPYDTTYGFRPAPYPCIAWSGVGCDLIDGDHNFDGKVDYLDLEPFEICASGPGVPWHYVQVYPGWVSYCYRCDYDRDGDVDQYDFSVQQRLMTDQE